MKYQIISEINIMPKLRSMISPNGFRIPSSGSQHMVVGGLGCIQNQRRTSKPLWSIYVTSKWGKVTWSELTQDVQSTTTYSTRRHQWYTKQQIQGCGTPMAASGHFPGKVHHSLTSRPIFEILYELQRERVSAEPAHSDMGDRTHQPTTAAEGEMT